MPLKDNIVYEAQKLFSLNGFLNTGINEIIDASGTSKGGFYNHFISKEDLFLAVLAQSQMLWRERVLHGLDDIDSPVGKIVKILNNYRDRYLKDSENFPGGCIFIAFSVELDDTRPHLMEQVNKGFEGFKRMLTGLLDDAVDQDEIPETTSTDAIAEMLFGGMLGASVLYGVAKDAATLDHSIDALIEYMYSLSNTHVLDHVQHNGSA
jgi:TetR/AcrR family transcriptional repressor of nem operon